LNPNLGIKGLYDTAGTNKITIVLDPCKGDRKLSLDVLSSIAKPFLETNEK
jgi:hypothetical protein